MQFSLRTMKRIGIMIKTGYVHMIFDIDVMIWLI